MTINSKAIMDQLTSYAAASGLFESVIGHEPKAAPPRTGVACGVWFDNLTTVQSSGLAAASVRLEFTMRIFTSMLQEPQDSIDPRVMDATDAMFTALIGDFDVAGNARYLDVLGSDGDPLRAESGYVDQDGTKFRVVTISIPIIINDAYVEVA